VSTCDCPDTLEAYLSCLECTEATKEERSLTNDTTYDLTSIDSEATCGASTLTFELELTSVGTDRLSEWSLLTTCYETSDIKELASTDLRTTFEA